MKEFAILPPNWDFTDSTEEGTEEKFDQLLSNNIVRENKFLVLHLLSYDLSLPLSVITMIM